MKGAKFEFELFGGPKDGFTFEAWVGDNGPLPKYKTWMHRVGHQAFAVSYLWCDEKCGYVFYESKRTNRAGGGRQV